MPETKQTPWTPGPWDYAPKLSTSENHRGYRVFSPGGSVIADVMPRDKDGIEGDANARVMTAAPELVEALEDCLRHINFVGRAMDALNHLPDYSPQLDDAERISFTARALLRRVRGEEA